MYENGQVSLGGLAREKWGTDSVSLVGFGTHRGETIASHAWGGETMRIRIPPARDDSIEDALHAVSDDLDEEAYYLPLWDAECGVFGKVRFPQRSIGVVYYPEHERYGNYVETALAKRYDAFVHVDETRAISPLAQVVNVKDIPEAFSSGV